MLTLIEYVALFYIIFITETEIVNHKTIKKTTQLTQHTRNEHERYILVFALLILSHVDELIYLLSNLQFHDSHRLPCDIIVYVYDISY